MTLKHYPSHDFVVEREAFKGAKITFVLASVTTD
jgi:hypothetical protein